MSFLKWILLLFLLWAIPGCSKDDGCFGYWEDDGLKRGTAERNKSYLRPYRQCVENTPPYRNKWKKRR